MQVTIEKLDNLGRGICYIDNKITFVDNALPNEIVDISLTKENKKYNEAIVLKYIKLSENRIDSICPHFNNCGGCNFLNLSYEDTLSYKKDKLTNIISKYAGINTNIEVIPSPSTINYRNKITLKVVNGKYGYFENNSHTLTNIDNCLLAEKAIYNFIKDVNYLNIKNGEVVIRSNYNDELLIWIKSEDEVTPDISYLKEHHKIVGIIKNDTLLIGESSFIEIINGMLFKVSYDSFFQINRGICSILFNEINNNLEESEVLLDLYCGVGTLGINSSKLVRKTYGIEIVKNAVLNAITNAKINKCENNFYLLGDVSKCLSKINDKVDSVIVDPPRAGLDKITKDTLIKFKPKKIIYVSCDPLTLARDLKELKEHYDIKVIKGLDMFPYTYHCESVCILERR